MSGRTTRVKLEADIGTALIRTTTNQHQLADDINPMADLEGEARILLGVRCGSWPTITLPRCEACRLTTSETVLKEVLSSIESRCRSSSVSTPTSGPSAVPLSDSPPSMTVQPLAHLPVADPADEPLVRSHLSGVSSQRVRPHSS